jgi:hypothetical protein
VAVRSPARRQRLRGSIAGAATVAALIGQLVAVAPVAAASPQAITFSLPASGTVGALVDLVATADSGLPVAFAADTLDTCTVTATSLSLVAPGTCTVTATQDGDGGWDPATPVQASMTVEPIAPPAGQTITFTLPASGLVGATLELNGLASSGLPVDFASSTAPTCTVSASSLHLVAPGSCTVAASQPGNGSFLPATDVERSIQVEAVPQGVDLGRYAVNGTVKAAVSDATTGTTYIGGNFTSIGLRTGPVAVVDPPGAGDGALRAASPEVLGTVNGVYADDLPGDPGFFVVGELVAVNGQPVPQVPVIRIHLDDAAQRWVVDPSWAMTDPTGICQGLADSRNWSADEGTLFAGLATSAGNPSAIWRIDRATGFCTPLVLPNSAPLPQLAGCAGQAYCYAQAFNTTLDASSSHLAVVYIAYVGATADSVTQTLIVASFDLSTRARQWVTALQGARPPDAGVWDSRVFGLAVTGDVVVVRGEFMFDIGDDGYTVTGPSRTVVLDATTGAITHRWNGAGEESLLDGSTIGPGTACLTGEGSGPAISAFGVASQWLMGPSLEFSLCQYTVADGNLNGERLGLWTINLDAETKLPSVPVMIDGTPFLVSAWLAVSLADGTVADWHPEPGAAPNGPAWVAVSAGGAVVGGDFAFLRGASMPGVAVLRADMSPDPRFASPIESTPSPPDVRALALDDGWLLVGGQYYLPSDPGTWDLRSVTALDPATGALEDWRPTDVPNPVVTIAVDPGTASFWIGGSSRGLWGLGGQALLHFSAPGSGAGSIDAPDIGCLTVPAIPNFNNEPSVCSPPGDGSTEVRALAFDASGELYLAGLFGSIDGQPHRGLARLSPGGAVDSWAPDLLGAMKVPAGSAVYYLDPHAIAVSRGRVLVGGQFCSAEPAEGGGGHITCISPLLVFDAVTGAVVRPTGTDTFAWFPVFGCWTAGYAIVARDSGVVVALGDVGLVVLDPTTLDYDSAASAPYLNQGWWGHDFRVGVFALAAPAVPPALHATRLTPRVAALVSSYSTRIVFAGAIPRWGYHVAGNVVAASVASTPHLPVVTAPAAAVRAGAALSGTSIPVSLTWTGKDTGGPGIGHYEVARTTDGGKHWTTVLASLATPKASVLVAAAGTVRFRVRAVDRDGAIGAWVAGPTLSPRLIPQSSAAVRYHGAWSTTSSTRFSGGTARYARTAGASASYTFSGRSVSLVSTRALTRGKARIYVNGAYVTTIDLAAAPAGYRAVVWSRTWSTSVTRTVTIVVAGTKGRPRVDVDAFAVLR